MFAVAALSPAAEFTTGQAARALLGQHNFTTQDSSRAENSVGAAGGVAYANGQLFVTGSNRIVGIDPQLSRVVIFHDVNADVRTPDAEISIEGIRCPVCSGSADVVLGQPDFTTNDWANGPSGMRSPTAVASDGHYLAVADTDNNRVLIWNSIPSSNQAPADIVVGQEDFSKTLALPQPTASTLRGPQGVWIQGGRLYVADTLNHRVLIWNSMPTSNGQAADVVLGQPNFNVQVQSNLAQAAVEPKPETMLNPVSVTSDGVRLFVADLGHNRVLVWNALPSSNGAPADFAVGQPDLTSALANNVTALCQPVGQDENGEDLYPFRCGATLEFPRFALSDGTRLFVADGGNDRVLVFNTMPRDNGATADVALGQPSLLLNQVSDGSNPMFRSAADQLRTPMALAWDGTNLYVTDPFNRRVMVFSMGEPAVPLTGVRNAASLDVAAVGSIVFSGSVEENDEVTINIQDREYKYKVLADDSAVDVINALVNLINAGTGDPEVLATPNTEIAAIILTSRLLGVEGNSITYSASASATSQIVVETSGATLAGGGDAARIAPGTIVTIQGDGLAETTAEAPAEDWVLPTELGGVQVYFDGLKAPLLMVSPTKINVQVPWEILDATSINAYVRTVKEGGNVVVTTPVAVPIVPFNPGIFAGDGPDPRPAMAVHASSQASGTVSVDGSAKAGDVATVIIRAPEGAEEEDRRYTYTVQEGDTTTTIRDKLIEAINEDPRVLAFAAGVFNRIRLRAREEGEGGNGIVYDVEVNDGAQVILTATTSALCCANEAGAAITEENPALPGETIIVYATGLGLVQPKEAQESLWTGHKYDGPDVNEPNQFVDAMAGGKTANVLFAGLKKGEHALYEVHLELNSDIPTNAATHVTIAQDVFVSNIVSIPVFNPNPPEEEEGEGETSP